MALYRTRSAAVFGIDAHLIDVEVDMYSGGNKRDFITVGMPDTAVRESRERIKSALINSGSRHGIAQRRMGRGSTAVNDDSGCYTDRILGSEMEVLGTTQVTRPLQIQATDLQE